jgi:hypothetical protein
MNHTTRNTACSKTTAHCALTALLAAFTAAAALTACGGGNKEPAPTGAPAPTPTPGPAPAPTPTPEPPQSPPEPTPPSPPAPGTVLTPDTPPSSSVSFTIRSDQGVRPISPFIYGSNFADFNHPRQRYLTMTRSGGNRMTAYNWENNASNAGSDWEHQNDGRISASNVPGIGVTPAITQAFAHRAAALVTVPTIGYVAADKNGDGDVARTPNYLSVRFKQSVPKKNAPFTLTPSTTDAFVYQDEWVNFLKTQYPSAFTDSRRQLFFSLDNEPDLWHATHARLRGSTGIEGTRAGYAEMVQRSTDYASAIKDVAPNALVFGPVNYGWYGMVRLQDAPDANNRDFLDYYLAQMKSRSDTAGRRLVDVLDVHWYPEDRSGGVRVIGTEATAGVVAARLNAPRSLWDTSFVEPSWIGENVGAVRLLPRLKGKIDTHFPGTKLAITEYNYGGSTHISGGIAQADVLGIFGRENVFAATYWPIVDDNDYIWGGFEMYRNYDGAGGAFGDTHIQAQTSDSAQTSVYASVDAASPDRMVVVAINRTAGARSAGLRIWHTAGFSRARVYRLTSASSQPQAAGEIMLNQVNALQYTMPAYSVSTLVFTR